MITWGPVFQPFKDNPHIPYTYLDPSGWGSLKMPRRGLVDDLLSKAALGLGLGSTPAVPQPTWLFLKRWGAAGLH